MTRFYTACGQPNGLYRWIFLLICCAIGNFIYLPESHAQLSNSSYGESITQLYANSSQLPPESPVLQLNNSPSFTSPAYYTFNNHPVLWMPLFRDTTNEQSDNRDHPYLLDEDPAAQTLTLRLPKVDVGKILIAVYSPSGNLLMKKSVRNQKESEKEMEMDLKELQAGSYFLEIQAAEIYEKFSFMLE